MFIDLAIHYRLRKTRFISFVMTITAIADQVDHKILMEFMSVGERGARGLGTGLWIICINVNYGNFKSFRQIAGVQTAARFMLGGCKPQLVVSDDMQTAARYISGNTGEVNCFRDDTLPCK